ncbi:MAG: hypothetical protein LBB53_01680 [Prevotellaceae bacterium]|jgi:nitrate reductase NapE component|nr:hypothetical protein [Prevotellaceae bacterium]
MGIPDFMSLKNKFMYKCRTCNREVAATAIICPHCGDADTVYNNEIHTSETKIDKTRKKRRRWIVFIVFAIWLIVGFNLHGGGWVMLLWLFSLIVGIAIAIVLFENNAEIRLIESRLDKLRQLHQQLELKND